jgi:two-component system sensor histidine kinase AgrC
MKKMNARKNMNNNNNVILMYAIAVSVFGIVLIGGLFYLFFIRRQISFELQIAMIVAVVIEVIAMSLLFGLIKVRTSIKQLEDKNRLLIESNKNTSELNTKMRVQRHDFLNHLQVIHGLLELNQYKDACQYMETTYDEIQSVSNVLKTSLPALNAILQVKQHICNDKSIQFKVLATSKLQYISMDVWDLCAIVGNLIDNAINAVEGRDRKKVTVLIKEDIEKYSVKVKDNGYGIKKEIRDKIFKMGFTTKNDDGHGIGLATSIKTIEENGGNMFFISNEKGTIFTIEIPKKTV